MLGYKNTRDAISKHCKNTFDVAIHDGSQNRNMTIIPRADVYGLITKSKLPAAEKFEKWVFEEVLPSIHETGSYTAKSPFQTVADILSNPRAAAQILLDHAKLQEENEEIKEENALLTDELMKRLIFRQK